MIFQWLKYLRLPSRMSFCSYHPILLLFLKYLTILFLNYTSIKLKKIHYSENHFVDLHRPSQLISFNCYIVFCGMATAYFMHSLLVHMHKRASKVYILRQIFKFVECGTSDTTAPVHTPAATFTFASQHFHPYISEEQIVLDFLIFPNS